MNLIFSTLLLATLIYAGVRLFQHQFRGKAISTFEQAVLCVLFLISYRGAIFTSPYDIFWQFMVSIPIGYFVFIYLKVLYKHALK